MFLLLAINNSICKNRSLGVASPTFRWNPLTQELLDLFQIQIWCVRLPKHYYYILRKWAKLVDNHACFLYKKLLSSLWLFHFTVNKSNTTEVIRIKLCTSSALKVFSLSPKNTLVEICVGLSYMYIKIFFILARYTKRCIPHNWNGL